MTVERLTATKAYLALLGLLQATTIVTATSNTRYSEGGPIPTFSLSELESLSGFHNRHGNGINDRGDEFRQALSTTGLMAIRLDDESYSRDRNVALDGLCSCVDHPEFLELDQTHELTLQGSSTTRTSVATATAGLEHPLPLPEGLEATCGSEVWDAMEGLRETVATVSGAFASAMDRAVLDRPSHSHLNSHSNPTSRQYGTATHGSHRVPADTTTELLRDEFGKTYESISEIAKAANNLEHFHVYTNNAAEDNSSNSVAWDWHTDAGLFLVFVPAWNCHGGIDDESNVDNSFYYRDANGSTVRAKFEGDRTAIVMLGQGAQEWLDLPSPPSPKQQKSLLKATTHSVRWSEPSFRGLPKQRRAWYGMMNLVPETAMIYGGKTLREVKKSLSLSRQGKNNDNSSSSSDTMSLGCGGIPTTDGEEESVEVEEIVTTTQRRRRLQMQDAAMCNNVTNFYCWMTCMDIPKVDQAELYLEAGYNLYCLDKSVLKSSGSMVTAHEACVDVHNMGCKGQWEKTVDGIPTATIDVETTADEVELPFCYSGTTMYMEGFQWIQSSTCVIMLFPTWVLNSATKYVFAVIGTILAGIGLEKFIQQRRKTMAYMESGPLRLVVSAMFYGVQLTIGYMLMLVIMIYSGALFLSVIAGLVIGHVLFNAKDAIWPIHESPHLDGDDKKESSDNGSTNSGTGIEAPMSRAASQKSSCCADNTILLLESADINEQRPRGESLHSQGSESAKQYYGSMEDEKTLEVVASRKKTIDQTVPEGSTPCCQHGI